jgi:streptomycin 6-kinase
MAPADLAPWVRLWRLEPDGEAFVSPFGSTLAPVRFDGAPAMLKIAHGEEERRGAALMAWWAGEGAAQVLAWTDPALLLERADGARCLAAMARAGEDDAAMRILCGAAAALHAPRPAPPPASLVRLDRWFGALAAGAARRGGIFQTAWAVARRLLAAPRDERALHGDLHHRNVLDFGPRGWLAIDPKGLFGERGFDYANMVCNPDIATAGAKGALARRARIVCDEAGLEPERYLGWVLAYAALSASWTLDGGGDASPAVRMAELAAAELGLA